MKVGIVLVANLCLALLASSCASQTPKPSTYRWTKFVTVRGQPDPVPVEWVSTPEGAFAHSIEIPDPVPKDSGYREGMTSEEYFAHLCKTQAGEFVYKTVEGVEGFYFMRPPNQPTDKDLMDRFKLEDPYTERFYRIAIDGLQHRPAQFVNPPFRLYKYVEEPRREVIWQMRIEEPFVRMFGYEQKTKTPMIIVGVDKIASEYGYTWRGLKRARDREHGVAGSELIILDLRTGAILGVLRNFAISGRVRNTPDHIWWLTAQSCPQFSFDYRDNLGVHIYSFATKALRPAAPATMEGGQ